MSDPLTKEPEICRLCEGYNPVDCPECQGEVMVTYKEQPSSNRSHTTIETHTSKPLYTARHPAAFINAIADEGTKAEAVEWLQRTWDELCDLRAAHETTVKPEPTLAELTAEYNRLAREIHHRIAGDPAKGVFLPAEKT